VSSIAIRLLLIFNCALWPLSVHAAQRVVLVVGDSLSAAYGIDQDEGWVALLQRRLEKDYPGYRVVNASISGDTTRGALSRIDTALNTHSPAVVVVELGGNDGLRGLPLKEMRTNLSAIVSKSLAAHARVLLVGMRIPPNYGPLYTRDFEAVFTELAQQFEVARVPFLLDGVALDPELIQGDGIHPRADAQPRLLENVWPHLAPLLR
jgi:acyl-CoA thioesterase-1